MGKRGRVGEWQRHYKKKRLYTYMQREVERFIYLFRSVELTVLSWKGSVGNSVCFKDPEEREVPSASTLWKTQCELSKSATRVTDNSKQRLK